MFDFGRSNPLILWKPVVEPDFGQERFLIDDPVRSYQNGDHMKIPVITGMTKDEFVGPAICKNVIYLQQYLIQELILAILQSPSLLTAFNENFDSLAPICFLYNASSPRVQNISQELRQHYFGDQPINTNSSLESLATLFSDALTGFGIHRFVHLAARTTKVYYYRFAYQGGRSHIHYPEDAPYGVVHHDDLMYLFVEPSISRMFTEDDDEFRMVEVMTRMFSAFAYKGFVVTNSTHVDIYLN